MLVSPTERAFDDLGKRSSLPEKYGADFLWASRVGTVGVQRKEVVDLVSSLRDGRLSKELGQMQSLDLGVLVVEGRLQWTADGFLPSVRSFTRDQFFGVLFSVQSQGLWCFQTTDITNTAQLLVSLQAWLSKDRHGMIRNRPKASGEWGKATNREWGIHLLQSFPGIGSEVAGRIYDEFGGVPLRWDCGTVDLQEVRGVGKIRAENMIGAFRGRSNSITSADSGGSGTAGEGTE